MNTQRERETRKLWESLTTAEGPKEKGDFDEKGDWKGVLERQKRKNGKERKSNSVHTISMRTPSVSDNNI